MSDSLTSNTNTTGRTGPAYAQISDLMALRWKAKALKLPKAKKALRPQTGQHYSKFRGRGMEFSEVRVYQPGDDVRSIDWRVTARRQQAHTKIFNEERERPVLILCDQSLSQFFGSQSCFKSVRAAEAAALFAWTALLHNDRVGGIVFSEQGHQEVRPTRNRKTILQLLTVLCEFNHALNVDLAAPQKTFTINAALTEASRLAKPGTLLVVISDFHHVDENTQAQLVSLRQHSDLVLVRTSDPLEEHLPAAGVYPVSNGADTLVVNTHSPHTRDYYAQRVAEQHDALKKIAASCRAPLLEISTASDPAISLHALLASMS